MSVVEIKVAAVERQIDVLKRKPRLAEEGMISGLMLRAMALKALIDPSRAEAFHLNVLSDLVACDPVLSQIKSR